MPALPEKQLPFVGMLPTQGSPLPHLSAPLLSVTVAQGKVWDVAAEACVAGPCEEAASAQ